MLLVLGARGFPLPILHLHRAGQEQLLPVSIGWALIILSRLGVMMRLLREDRHARLLMSCLAIRDYGALAALGARFADLSTTRGVRCVKLLDIQAVASVVHRLAVAVNCAGTVALLSVQAATINPPTRVN